MKSNSLCNIVTGKNAFSRSMKTAAIIGLLSFLLTGCGSKSNSGETGAASTAATSDTSVTAGSGAEGTDAETVNGISLPYAIDEGNLTVNSVFTSDIDNPDAGNQIVEGLVSVEVENTSGSYLTQASLTVTLDDGRAVPIRITDLPAGEKIWAFATDNSAAASGVAEITAVEVSADESEYTDAASNIDGLDMSVEGTAITVTNNTGSDLGNLNVFCHAKMDDVLFGGITYTYTVDYLSAGETTTIDAADCWLGEAEVIGAYVQ